MKITVADLADRLGGELVGRGDVEVAGISPVSDVKPGDVTWAETDKHLALAEASAAAAIVVSLDVRQSAKPLVRVKQPRVAMAKMLAIFFPAPEAAGGVHQTAVVGRDVKLGVDVRIGPNAVVEDGATIGDRTVIGAGSVVGRDVVIGADCLIHSNATVYPDVRIGDRVILHSGAVIGSDGFGYVWDGHAHLKIPQVGTILIEEDVEIGANAAIDRSTIGATIIKRGTKIDNLVQIAHNVTIGEHSTVCGQVGIAGSCTIGDKVTLAGQVGMADHITIGDNVTVGAQSGVKNDLAADAYYLGTPAVAVATAARQYAVWAKLPELSKRVRALEKRIDDIQNALKTGATG